jgi:hypothetical protein
LVDRERVKRKYVVVKKTVGRERGQNAKILCDEDYIW